MKLKFLSLVSALAAGTLCAQPVEIRDAWVRTSVQGQKATGVFMKITAKEATKLVSASSPVAGVTEIHAMNMEGDVMKMRAVNAGLDIGAGKTMEFKPGGFHIMLMDLKTPLPINSTVTLTLVFKDSKGAQSSVELKAPTATSAPGLAASKAGSTPAAEHGKHKP